MIVPAFLLGVSFRLTPLEFIFACADMLLFAYLVRTMEASK